MDYLKYSINIIYTNIFINIIISVIIINNFNIINKNIIISYFSPFNKFPFDFHVETKSQKIIIKSTFFQHLIILKQGICLPFANQTFIGWQNWY